MDLAEALPPVLWNTGTSEGTSGLTPKPHNSCCPLGPQASENTRVLLLWSLASVQLLRAPSYPFLMTATRTQGGLQKTPSPSGKADEKQGDLPRSFSTAVTALGWVHSRVHLLLLAVCSEFSQD